MMHNVNSLFPRPVRAVPDPLALWLRPGRMDHKGMLDMIAAGDVACFGAVFDPVLSGIHAELREQVLKHRLDAVLDPKTQPAAMLGGYTEALGSRNSSGRSGSWISTYARHQTRPLQRQRLTGGTIQWGRSWQRKCTGIESGSMHCASHWEIMPTRTRRGPSPGYRRPALHGRPAKEYEYVQQVERPLKLIKTGGAMSNAIARKLDSIQRKSAMRSVDVANVVGARPETVSRWNQGKAFPRPDAQKLLLELEYIVDQLSDFYEPQDARLWMFSRQKLLGGEIPAELIQKGRGAQVIAVIDRLREGTAG